MNNHELTRDLHSQLIAARARIAELEDFVPVRGRMFEAVKEMYRSLQAFEERIAADTRQRGDLGRSVDELELSVRSANCLHTAGIRTLGDLVDLTKDDLLDLKNFNEKCLVEITTELETLGLKLRLGARKR